MSKKKQGFLQGLANQAKPVKKAFGFIPEIVPFVRDQKNNLDSWSEIARERLKNPAKSNLDLGKKFLEESHIGDAITRFKLAIFMKKDYGEAYFYLSKALISQGKVEKAYGNLKTAKELDYQSSECDYFYDIYCNHDSAAIPDDELLKSYFDIFSDIFDEHYIENFDYRGVDKICELFKTHVNDTDKKILDLGCGRGFVGKKIKENANDLEITGLDFSDKMIEFAKKLTIEKTDKNSEEVIDLTKNNKNEKNEDCAENIYSYLIKTSFENYKNEAKNKYDVVLSRGIFSHVGDFTGSIKKTAKLINKGGLFIFYLKNSLNKSAIEKLSEEFSYPFFCNHHNHDEKPAIKTCEDNDFQFITKQSFELEKDSNATVFVFEKL